MNAEFIEALNAIEKERGISKDILIDAFESALIAAYKRNYGAAGNVRAAVDRDIAGQGGLALTLRQGSRR